MTSRPMDPLGIRLSGAEDEAVADCYHLLAPRLRRYLHGRIPEADVEDVVQVVFVELWRFRDRYDPHRSLEAWVLALARKRAIDHLRSRYVRRTVTLDDPSALAGSDGRDMFAQVERSCDLRSALAQLPDPQRQAIELAYFTDLSQREIADRLGVPLGTIKARTARGLRRLSALIVSAAAV